jgi:hypothetical protein
MDVINRLITMLAGAPRAASAEPDQAINRTTVSAARFSRTIPAIASVTQSRMTA